MIEFRPASARGNASFGWLDSYHSFSFGHYYDPAYMGFGALRVINEDRVQPGKGFNTHGHRDMEIISYVIDGALEHKDSTGTGSIIRPGDVQRMTAGSGVTHSEFNASDTDVVHFLQIWIEPERMNLQPGYEQKFFDPVSRGQGWCLIGSRDGREDSITIHQDISVFSTLMSKEQTLPVDTASGRKGWLQVVRGVLSLGSMSLQAGDGVALEGPENWIIESNSDSELLLFDMAAG